MSTESFLISNSVLSTRCSVLSSYDLIRSRENIRRDRDADLFRGFQVDHQLEFCRSLYRQIGWLCTFEDFVYIGGGAPIQVEGVHAIKHKPSRFYKLTAVVYRGEPVSCREFYNLGSLQNENAARQCDKTIGPPIGCGSKCRLDIFGI